MIEKESNQPLRKGWTTGTCATAATAAAFHALITGRFPDPVTVILPNGLKPSFPIHDKFLSDTCAKVGIIKDAGDDPDVTHGAIIYSTVKRLKSGQGIIFKAGEGIGTVTKPGLPLQVGEPAINPVPRQFMAAAAQNLAYLYKTHPDIEITLSIPNGETLAKSTWNSKLGIIGGLSILGTTGVVIPYSCSAWIASIHRGIDVCRANNITHAAACTGSVSEQTIKKIYQMPDIALLDMGDFVGGTLKYLRKHPISRLTIGGGFGKISKLAAGHKDLHSKRSQVDRHFLANILEKLGAQPSFLKKILEANTADQIIQESIQNQLPLGDFIARQAKRICLDLVDHQLNIEIIIVNRTGHIVGQAGF
ncbi:MAG: cobalt-precorrin-5B (C(1))-methyltransferase [Alphaproteobacteria bacterium]|nr:cobalt-precorrin-5B (C(1))-methyltransferase [Alphaproteobacteria bacterium]